MSETEAQLSSSHRECAPRVAEMACFEAACAALKAAREFPSLLEMLEQNRVKTAAIKQKIDAGRLLDAALIVPLSDLMRVLEREMRSERYHAERIYDHEDGRRDRVPMWDYTERGQRLQSAHGQLAGFLDALETFHERVHAASEVERLLQ